MWSPDKSIQKDGFTIHLTAIVETEVDGKKIRMSRILLHNPDLSLRYQIPILDETEHKKFYEFMTSEKDKK